MRRIKEHCHLLIKCLYREGTEEEVQALEQALKESSELRKYYHQWAETKCWLEEAEVVPPASNVDKIMAYVRKINMLDKKSKI